MLITAIVQMSGCKTISPERDESHIIDASRNLKTVLYHAVARPDNPVPVQSTVFVRHFLYINRSAPWTIVSSGASNPGTQFEATGVYRLRLGAEEQPVRLLGVPGFQTDGISQTGVRLAIAAPSLVVLDGVGQIRNTSGQALVHLEGGPLYGGFTVDELDTVEVYEQVPRLLFNGRVRAAALAFDGATAAFVDEAGRLYRLDTGTRGPPELLVDLRSFFGPSVVLEIQWPIGSDTRVLLKVDRGSGPESWSVRMADLQVGPSTVAPGLIEEPGADRLRMVDQLTQKIPAGVWRVPAPSRFE